MHWIKKNEKKLPRVKIKNVTLATLHIIIIYVMLLDNADLQEC